MSEPTVIHPDHIDDCLSKDRHRLRIQLRQWQQGRLNPEQVETFAQRLENSRASVQMRRQSVPKIDYPDLPVSEKVGEIQSVLAKHPVVIVCGETGSGKTTQLPKICLQMGLGARGMIGHTQPRRIAAHSVAQRIAEECSVTLGEAVGYCVRFHDHTGPSTLVKLMTDGILLAEIQQDAYLSQYETLIIDEAHERSLNTDFLLGYLKWLLPKRPDLKVIITSATIDTERFAKHFDAPVIEVSGRTYPVECRYRPVTSADQDQTDLMLDSIRELRRDNPGDILIFLSGEREIRDAAQTLRRALRDDTEILPLYGRLSAHDQAAIFKSHRTQRIVLATNVAETSVTVPGIRSVIDTGLARISRYSLRNKIQQLPIEPISQASANQRAGRCGRVAPGICIRLYEQADLDARPPFTEPEILRTNLAAVILQMKHLGLGDIESFPFLEPPDPKAIRSGIRLLQELNALDRSQRLTPIGRAMARFPIEPRLARVLVEASNRGCLTEACILVAGLSIQDPRDRPGEEAQKADQKHAEFRDKHSDFVGLLKLWHTYQDQKKQLSHNQLRQYCRKQFLSYMRLSEWEEVNRQLMRIATRELHFRLNHVPATEDELHRSILPGFLSHIGMKEHDGSYQGARNLKFHIYPGSALRKSAPKWVVAAEQVETSRVFARMVARIDPSWIEEASQHVCKRHHGDPHWSRKLGQAMIKERVTLFGLTIEQGRSIPLRQIDPVLAREWFIREGLVEQGLDTHAKFFRHNQNLLAEAGYIEQKQRQADLVVDAQWLFDFYDRLIPADVVDIKSFDRWRIQQERNDPSCLRLTADRLMQQADRYRSASDYPDHIQIGGLSFPLAYRFEPGASDDGVTLVVQLHQLNQLQPAEISWLVPGLVREKLIQLTRTLPKPLRRKIGPIPDFVDQLPTLPEPLTCALTDWLAQQVQTRIGQQDHIVFDETALDAHLRMNIRVKDQNQVVAESRDLAALQGRYGTSAKRAFATKAQTLQPEQNDATHQRWDFEDLPTSIQVNQQGQNLCLYPALVGIDEGVKIQSFDTEAAASAAHRTGLYRLICMELASELKYLRRHLRPYAKLDLALAQLEGHPVVASSCSQGSAVDQIIQRAVTALFIEAQADVRTRAEYGQRMARKSELIPMANEVAALFQIILNAHSEIKSAILSDALPDVSRNDMRQQLQSIVFKCFYSDTSFESLQQYPRYLRGMQTRLHRLQHAPDKDVIAIEKIAAFDRPFWDWVRVSKISVPAVQATSFRWLLEEYRISLFSQPMKTRLPVSEKRLQNAWSQLQGKL